jgi:preprotein translocase subunit SecA
LPQDLNYYEILGIATGASPEQIKRAYFKNVRTYPPERFPEEFKKLRAAYETLSDPKSREQYDKSSVDNKIDVLFDKAKDAFENDDYRGAIRLAEMILALSPDFYPVQNLIGMSYIRLEEYNLAVNTYKKLVRNSGGSQLYYHNLGCALYYAGSIKQAVEALNTAIDYGLNDIDDWIYLANCYSAKKDDEKARSILKECMLICGETVSVHLELIELDVKMENHGYIKADIDELEKFARKDPKMRENVAWSLSKIAEDVMYLMPIYSEEILKRAKNLIPKGNKKLESLHEEAKKEKLLHEHFNIISKDNLVHPWIKDIIYNRFFTQTSMLKPDDLEIVERILMYRPQNILSSVERIKSQYPFIFHELSYYFGMILDNPDGCRIDEGKLLSDVNEEGARLSPKFKVSSVDEIVIPNMQVINTNKTGRNDPCPCGSGKKYKKCCMT